MIGNTRLVEHGIQNEASDLRAHVCVLAEKVYVFRTADAVKIMNYGIELGRYLPVSIRQPGVDVVTAICYPVPVGDLRTIEVSAQRLIREQRFSPQDSTSAKGKKAVNVVTQLIRMGWFPLLAVHAEDSTDFDLQVSGVDILIAGKWRIQVKCDYKSGIGNGCTGKLWLQTHECNPLRAI